MRDFGFCNRHALHQQRQQNTKFVSSTGAKNLMLGSWASKVTINPPNPPPALPWRYQAMRWRLLEVPGCLHPPLDRVPAPESGVEGLQSISEFKKMILLTNSTKRSSDSTRASGTLTHQQITQCARDLVIEHIRGGDRHIHEHLRCTRTVNKNEHHTNTHTHTHTHTPQRENNCYTLLA